MLRETGRRLAPGAGLHLSDMLRLRKLPTCISNRRTFYRKVRMDKTGNPSLDPCKTSNGCKSYRRVGTKSRTFLAILNFIVLKRSLNEACRTRDVTQMTGIGRMVGGGQANS